MSSNDDTVHTWEQWKEQYEANSPEHCGIHDRARAYLLANCALTDSEGA